MYASQSTPYVKTFAICSNLYLYIGSYEILKLFYSDYSIYIVISSQTAKIISQFPTHVVRSIRLYVLGQENPIEKGKTAVPPIVKLLFI